MTLQLQRCGECRHDNWQVTLKLPWERELTRMRPRKIARLQARAENDVGLSSSVSSTETARDVRLSLLDRWKGFAGNFVAAPRYLSRLRPTRPRDEHELRMETRERVFLSISDWVSRRVQDPLVEIDPVTVSMAIQVEKQAKKENAAATSTIPVSVFGYHPPFLPGRVNKDTLAATILILLIALLTAAILALRGKKKIATDPKTGTIGSSTNGDARPKDPVGDECSALASQDNVDLNIVTVVGNTGSEKPEIAWPSTFTGQFTRPSSNSSVLPDQSGLPLPERPPLPIVISEDKKLPESCSTEEVIALSIPEAESTSLVGDLPVSFIESDYDMAHGEQIENSETDVITVTIDEEIASSNGGIVTSFTPEGTDDVELGNVASQTESPIEQLPPTSVESISTGESSPAVESFAAVLDEEYILCGDSVSLSPIARLATVELNVARPTAADPNVGPSVAANSEDLGEVFAAQPLSGSIGGQHPAVLDGNVNGAETINLRPSLTDHHPVTETTAIVEDREIYLKILKKVLPAASVGAGVAALSTFSGVDGAFQMVGLLATTSFLTGSLIWAGERQQLVEEISNIKDHSQLIDFLRVRKIIPESSKK